MRFHSDNFLHLTGINTKLRAAEFFDKCLNDTISPFEYDCDSTVGLKGKVREKLNNLVKIGNFFDEDLIFQEMFEKNRVKCKIASSDYKYTLGFISINNIVHVPLTLLNRNQIDEGNGIRNYTIVRIVKQSTK